MRKLSNSELDRLASMNDINMNVSGQNVDGKELGEMSKEEFKAFTISQINKQDRKKNIVILIVCGIIFIPFMYAALSDEPSRPLSKQEKLESQFGGDGSHRKLEAYIKANMNDPGSYEHVETRYLEMDDGLRLTTKFRGKNVFGGVVTQTVKAKSTDDVR